MAGVEIRAHTPKVGCWNQIRCFRLKKFHLEAMMDAPAEFRKHGADCEKMAKVSKDPETKATWKRMAERWLLCAKLAEDEPLTRIKRPW
jgi:hypothetical protein